MMNNIQIFAQYAVLIIMKNYAFTKIFNKLESIFIYLKLITVNRGDFFYFLLFVVSKDLKTIEIFF